MGSACVFRTLPRWIPFLKIICLFYILYLKKEHRKGKQNPEIFLSSSNIIEKMLPNFLYFKVTKKIYSIWRSIKAFLKQKTNGSLESFIYKGNIDKRLFRVLEKIVHRTNSFRCIKLSIFLEEILKPLNINKNESKATFDFLNGF